MLETICDAIKKCSPFASASVNHTLSRPHTLKADGLLNLPLAVLGTATQTARCGRLALPQLLLAMVHIGPDDEAEERQDYADDEKVSDRHGQVSVAGGPTNAN
jgi:hypothetical protein